MRVVPNRNGYIEIMQLEHGWEMSSKRMTASKRYTKAKNGTEVPLPAEWRSNYYFFE